jgi:methanogenic corrinoid protein MtbC1
MTSPVAGHRIGAFSRRVGVSPELLRAWERRYGLLAPVRSQGGFRLYTAGDEERVARMREGLAVGLSAAEAARRALDLAAPAPDAALEGASARLLAAVEGYDEEGVHAVLDESLAAFGLEAALRELLLPALRAVGERWERGELSVSQEHFASQLLRTRLLALARTWGRGHGPQAILACAPGELHDITLIALGLLLRTHGWRIIFLGADTPVDTVRQAAGAVVPALVVLVAFTPEALAAEAATLEVLAAAHPLALGGPGASEALCSRVGARCLGGDLLAAAQALGAAAVS